MDLLSDQTNWLDELNARCGFFRWFDYVLNSYYLRKRKKDPPHFEDVIHVLGIDPYIILGRAGCWREIDINESINILSLSNAAVRKT